MYFRNWILSIIRTEWKSDEVDFIAAIVNALFFGYEWSAKLMKLQ